MSTVIAAPETPYFAAVLEVFRRIATTFPHDLGSPIRAVLVGGAAVHVHTHRRVSADVEALFARRVLLPQDLVLEWRDEQGLSRTLAYDYNYFGELGLLHPDAISDAWTISPQPDPSALELAVFTPVDLILSKVARWGAQDREDVDAVLAMEHPSLSSLGTRADEALAYYVGDMGPVRSRVRLIEDAVKHHTP